MENEIEAVLKMTATGLRGGFVSETSDGFPCVSMRLPVGEWGGILTIEDSGDDSGDDGPYYWISNDTSEESGRFALGSQELRLAAVQLGIELFCREWPDARKY